MLWPLCARSKARSSAAQTVQLANLRHNQARVPRTMMNPRKSKAVPIRIAPQQVSQRRATAQPATPNLKTAQQAAPKLEMHQKARGRARPKLITPDQVPMNPVGLNP